MTATATTRERPADLSIVESTAARLAALEHLLDAVTVLLDAGERERASTLAHAWRISRP